MTNKNHCKIHTRVLFIALVAIASACANQGDDDDPKTANTPGTGGTTVVTTGSSGKGAGPIAGSSSMTDAAGGKKGSASNGSGGVGSTSQQLALPAGVCKVLQDNGCVGCHQAQRQGGAPMALQWQSDFTALAKDGAMMSAKVLARTKSATEPMPPVTSMRPLMSDDDHAVLQTWIEGGMQADKGSACEEGAAPNETVPDWATQPWPGDECEYVLTVATHSVDGTSSAEDKTPYITPAAETNYHCFYEPVPWGDKPAQALAMRARFMGRDDKAVVHHLVVSAAIDPSSGMSVLGGETPTAAGEHHDCPNPSGSTVGVWAPGAQDPVTLPNDVGVLMPSGKGAFIELQIHYNNAQEGQESRVEYDICATTKMRANTAAVHWLGYENATLAVPLAAGGPELQPQLDNQGDGTAIGTCSAKERARVLWIAPHMHAMGRQAKVELLHADGTAQTLHEGPFNFEEQTAYFQKDLWVEQGEKIRTTCTWDTSHKIVFGLASSEEMCFVYTLAYPVGALAGQGAELGIVGGNLSCAGSE